MPLPLPSPSRVTQMRLGRSRKPPSVKTFLIASATFTAISLLLILTLRSLDDPSSTNAAIDLHFRFTTAQRRAEETAGAHDKKTNTTKDCATVEEMGDSLHGGVGGFHQQSLRVRRLIHNHFVLNGASLVRDLPSEEFCRHGYVIAKASEAGFGNEMYKILTAAALSIMLNRSLIIGQTRHIGSFSNLAIAIQIEGKYPFGDYISYSNATFTLKEVKHLWRKNRCLATYGKRLVIRIDDFQKPTRTDVLCGNWREWEEPIIWFQNTTDAVAAQFFLKNIHIDMRKAASELFGLTGSQDRPNVFGELMRVLISPSESIEQVVISVIGGGRNPDITLHMRMLMNRSVRAMQAALDCIIKSMHYTKMDPKPRLVLVSDTPSLVKDMKSVLDEFAEVLHFDYETFKGDLSGKINGSHSLEFRTKDWGPAPRWVAFVDFFLASRAKHTVVSGAHRRVGTTYAQLIAALAASHAADENSSDDPSFSFLSSFQSNLVSEGLENQVGWGHVWNRYAGPLSCRNQSNQCARTPLLPPAWWDGLWQSPISRDIRRMEAYGINLSGFGTFDEESLYQFCSSKKNVVVTIPLI